MFPEKAIKVEPPEYEIGLASLFNVKKSIANTTTFIPMEGMVYD
mgnify:FL=1|jgi:hypothetical protein|tara:strand:- start:62 stop:193 length:132 start_codon:yes stop_codon:yes gene_type:complete